MNVSQTIIACPQCRARNRVALNRLDERPRCGKCGAALPPAAGDRPVAVTDATFDREVFASSLPVLVDCWAPWCGPCKAIGPVLDELARAYRGRLKIAKLNVDDNPRTAATYGIRSIPTLLFVKNGQLVDTQVGAPPKNALVQRIEQVLLS
ncbi:MAG: thioredoxin [Thermodesulfobacteriota bacterium]